MIDITKTRKKMLAASGDGLWADMSGNIQAQGKIAFAGGIAGFMYAVYNRKPNWFLYTIGGLVAGSVVGYGIDWAKSKK